ncbi:MAG: glutamyl-tRNA reductase [Opitutaceae bacterium]
MNGADFSGEDFFVLGAGHHAAPIEVRERLALTPETAEALQDELVAAGAVREIALLSTCNRVEFYGVAADASGAARLEGAFCERQRFDPAEFVRLRTKLHGRDALRHLFEVAAGLDSQLLGETEILGQVKDAYAAAQARHSVGPLLHRIFQKTLQAAKHVRSQTAIASGQVSVASVAVELGQNVFGSLANVRVLLVGAGEIGEKTARAFQSRGAGPIAVASRRLERAMELATRLGAAALPFEQREARLAEFDVVVCATAAPGFILAESAIAEATRRRPARPFLLLDLALPRDIEPSAGSMENAFLYNLDDLARIAEENRRLRQAEVVRCRKLLEQRAAALWADLERRRAAAAPRPSPEPG